MGEGEERRKRERERGKIKKSAFIEERNVSSPYACFCLPPLEEINFPPSSVTLHPSTFLRTVEHVLEIFIRLTRSSWKRRKLDGQWKRLWPIYSFAWVTTKIRTSISKVVGNTDGNESTSSSKFQLKMDRKLDLSEFGKILLFFFFFSIKKKFQQIISVSTNISINQISSRQRSCQFCGFKESKFWFSKNFRVKIFLIKLYKIQN